MSNRHTKDPDAVKDYPVDWTLWLSEDEEITDATAARVEPGEDDPEPPTIDSVSFTESRVAIWLSGGEVSSKRHPITCHITTNQGRQDDRTIYIKVQEL